VFAGESLLKMITELKHSILVNDFETMNESITRFHTQFLLLLTAMVIQKTTEQYNKEREIAETSIHKLNKEVSDAIYELEVEYYTSNYRGKLAPLSSADTSIN
jgi:hypothetical protein